MFVAILFSVISAANSGVRPDTPPQLRTKSAPAAMAGQSYELALAVVGGDGQYRWQAIGLPDGMGLSEDGVVQGTPIREQTAVVWVSVTDGAGRRGEGEVRFEVRPSGSGAVQQVRPRIVDKVLLLDGATAGRPYEHQFRSESGIPPYRWTSSPLPDGLKLLPNGVLTGRADEAGTSTFAVSMIDGSGALVSQEVRLVVREAPESWLWWFLGWVKTVIEWLGYFCVAVNFVFLIFGVPAHAGTPPIWKILKIRKRSA
ncbi:hypothetical protein GCM10010470_41220 [Saccharopolyspora taberi]|uniref:Uncharacterized protein n=2 Tax=Saccharopolyspora taberi TaxID=60895 RepID=A0ABN3VHK6_9PSEU